jgi:hypothetical protein
MGGLWVSLRWKVWKNTAFQMRERALEMLEEWSASQGHESISSLGFWNLNKMAYDSGVVYWSSRKSK